MPITISEISKDSYTDIHGRREYEQRYIALSGETVVGAADTIEALLEDVAHCCREAGIEIPEEVVVWDQARFMGFNTDTALGKFTAIVKLEEGMGDRDARFDAISLMRSAFGAGSAIRVSEKGALLAEMPEGAWEDKNCAGWGWMAKGYLPEQRVEKRLSGFVLVTLENTQTAAFADLGRNSEIKRILLEAAERVRVEGVGEVFPLHDVNGNAVGRVELVDSVPREPVEVSSGANGRVRVELDLRRDAFQGEDGPSASIAASVISAAEKIASGEAEGGFLLNAPDGDFVGAVCLNRLPEGVLEDDCGGNEMSEMTLIEKRAIKHDYGLDGVEAIVDHPVHGRLLVCDGFGGMDSLRGGAVRFEHGMVCKLHDDDTFDALDADWNESVTVLYAVRNGYDDSRPVLDWTGMMVAKMAARLGELNNEDPSFEP